MTKVQLDDRWGRPSGLWSENGVLQTAEIDTAQLKREIDERVKAMNAGPQPWTVEQRKWVEAQKDKRRR